MSEVTVAGSIAFAVYAGVLTFFSPCAYPLLPGYVGFYVSQTEGRSSIGGAFARGLVAGVGVLLTLGVFIGATFMVGQSAVERLTYVEPGVGIILIVFGYNDIRLRSAGGHVPLSTRLKRKLRRWFR